MQCATESIRAGHLFLHDSVKLMAINYNKKELKLPRQQHQPSRHILKDAVSTLGRLSCKDNEEGIAASE